MVLGRVASTNTGCSMRRVSTRERRASTRGLSLAWRFDFTSLADQPAVESPGANGAWARPSRRAVISAAERTSDTARIIVAQPAPDEVRRLSAKPRQVYSTAEHEGG